jgi:phosphate transport system permease protein
VGRAGIRYRLLLDRGARLIISLGGIAIVGVIMAILLVLFVEVAPLFQRATAVHLAGVTVPAVTPAARIGVDEYRQLGYIADVGGIKIFSLQDGATLASSAVPLLNHDSITAISEISQAKCAFATESGKVLFCEVNFEVSVVDAGRKIEANATFSEPISLADRHTVRSLAYRETKDGKVLAAASGARELLVARLLEQKAVVGPSSFSAQNWSVVLPVAGEISAIAADDRGENLFVGTSDGRLARVDLRVNPPGCAEVAATNSGARITALNLLIGDRTLIAGDDQGEVSSWQLLADAGGGWRLQRIHKFLSHSAAVTAISASNRDKGFLTGDEKGGVKLHYGTTGSTRLSFFLPAGNLETLAYAPRADGFVTLSADGLVSHYALENHHPEVTLASLFGKVWYEGDSRPVYTWQSTGGADDFEPKLGLVPLIFGTLKGSFYTLLFCVPIAILAALYASQFMQQRWKNLIKPTVEIMAGLPSVVLGFIAALWLAPNVDRVLPGILVMPLIASALILLSVILRRALPATLLSRVKPGRELIVLFPVIALGVWLSIKASSIFTAMLTGGDYHAWLTQRLGLSYEQRNSLVVSLAMGFAVIPIIFTIAEDALSNVPRHLVLAARALGANKWETAMRIVLPTASPGIFSAIMIGLGRAVGETMIVLMATGNTPITSWNIFNGFRALSANIAVELPEAPAGGTLYRVLFLTALLLFAMTFIVNTAAEVVRLRLRKRYSLL